jgi:hypothetical protein
VVRDGAGSVSLSLATVGSGAPIGPPATTFCREIRARLPALDAAAAPADGATLADSTVRTPDVDGHQFKLRTAGGSLFQGCCSLKHRPARHRLLKQRRSSLVYEPVPSREFTRAIGPRHDP